MAHNAKPGTILRVPAQCGTKAHYRTRDGRFEFWRRFNGRWCLLDKERNHWQIHYDTAREVRLALKTFYEGTIPDSFL